MSESHSSELRTICVLVTVVAFVCGPSLAAAETSKETPRANAETESNTPPTPVVAALAIGSGLGQRFVRLPTRAGYQQLDAGFFPVLDVHLFGELAASDRTLVGAEARYQTSVGLTARATPPAGAVRETSLRSHHLDFGMTGGLRFGDSESSVSARVFAGWAFRGLRAVIDIDIPSYSMHGPILRPEFRIPIAKGAVVLHLQPEIFFVAHLSDELRTVGATTGLGFALGGEVAVDIRLSRRADFTLSYRESHARFATAWSSSFTDNERFATVGVALRY